MHTNMGEREKPTEETRGQTRDGRGQGYFLKEGQTHQTGMEVFQRVGRCEARRDVLMPSGQGRCSWHSSADRGMEGDGKTTASKGQNEASRRQRGR